MKIPRDLLAFAAMAGLTLTVTASSRAQTSSDGSGGTNPTAHSENSERAEHKHRQVIYTRPTEKLKLHSYLFDAFGPYPIVGAALVAGVNQAEGTPPEWGGGAAAYGQRVGSNFGISAISTTTRYALSEVFKEDTLYYRCSCTGFFPRFGHAIISTVSARRGNDGHRVFSIPSLVAPYVGTMTAAYTWYPDRYNASDAFRMGNYNLLAILASNVSMEFLYRGPHSFLSRVHLNNPRAAPEPDDH